MGRRSAATCVFLSASRRRCGGNGTSSYIVLDWRKTSRDADYVVAGPTGCARCLPRLLADRIGIHPARREGIPQLPRAALRTEIRLSVNGADGIVHCRRNNCRAAAPVQG